MARASQGGALFGWERAWHSVLGGGEVVRACAEALPFTASQVDTTAEAHAQMKELLRLHQCVIA